MSDPLLNYSDLDDTLGELAGAPAWCVAYSGGADSVVLLHLLHRWCEENPGAPALSAIHINHGMQAAADGWQAHCEAMCSQLAVPLIVRSVQVSASGTGEAAARQARYQVFEECLPEGAVLFMGHHLDDQVETFFLRLMRGAGVEGLAAIPVRRPLAAGLLVRPLLAVSRNRIEQYAAHYRLPHVEDPSNEDTTMDRNFLRAEVLPLLASRWPAYRQTVARASSHMAVTVTNLGDVVGVPETLENVMGDRGLALDDLLAGGDGFAAIRLRAWLQSIGCQAPDQLALEEFLRQLRVAGGDARPRLASGGVNLQRYRGAVYLLPDTSRNPPAESLKLLPGEQVEVPGVGRIALLPTAGEGLLLAPGEYCSLDWRRGGERCRPKGRSVSTSLKKLLQEWGIPPWWRERIPLLYSDGALLAVGGLALCESGQWRSCAPPGQQLWVLGWERVKSTSGD